MADKKNNIEEYFKNSLGDFKIEPPEEAKKKLFFWLAASNFVVLYRNYIITSCVTVIVAVSAYFIMDTKGTETKTHVEKENKVAGEKVKDENKIEANSTAIYTTTSTTESKALERKERVAAVVEIEKTEKENSPVVTSIKASPERKIKNEDEKYAVLKAEHNNSNTAAPAENPSYATENTAGIVMSETIKEQIENPKEESVKDNSLENQVTVVADNLNNDIASVNQNNFSDTLSKIADLIDSVAAIIVNDTTDSTVSVAVKDTLLPTIAAAKKFEFYAGLSSAYSYWLNNDTTLNIALSFSVGEHKEWRYKNFLFGFDAQYTQQKMNLYSYIKDSSITYQYTPKYIYKPDSIKIDSVNYMYFTDTIPNGFDTTETNKYSSHKETKNLTIRYFTLPLFIGWNHSFGKHDVGITTGLAMSFLFNGNSNTIGTDTPRNFLLSGDVGLRYGYHLTNKFLISTGVNMRRTFSGFTTAYTRGNTGIGLNLGLFYKF